MMSFRKITVLVLCALLVVQACRPPSPEGEEHDSASDTTGLFLPIIAGLTLYEIFVISAAGAVVTTSIVYVVDQSTGEEYEFATEAEAQAFVRERRGRVAFSMQSASNQVANGDATARPVRPNANGNSIPTTIANQCNNQRRPGESTCSENICYISPSANNAAAARRIHSHNSDERGEDSCFVFKWRDNVNGSDPAHTWLPHYHLYEIGSDGRCLKNIHFYYTRDRAEFDKYQGRCKKY